MCSSRAGLALALVLILPAVWAGAGEPAGRDPLRPPGAVEAAGGVTLDPSAWRLASTLVADGRRVAIINGRTVQAGDRVGGARVLAIEPGRVRLDYRGRVFTIARPVTRVRKE